MRSSRLGHPLYILYTSGTTETPKGVVRDNGGHAVALAWSMTNIYGIGAGDTFWAASDVGCSYIVYGPLLAGATTVLFEGKPVGTPDPGTFRRTIARHDFSSFFTAPTAVRAIRKEEPDTRMLKEIGIGACRASGRRTRGPGNGRLARTGKRIAGDRSLVADRAWLARHRHLLRHGRPAPQGRQRRVPVPGFQFAILDDEGAALPDGPAAMW